MMSHSPKPSIGGGNLDLNSLTDQLRDSLSSFEANKPDFRELDLGSPVSPLRTRGGLITTATATATATTTTTSSSSSSSGSASGAQNPLHKPNNSNHSGELSNSSESSPTAGSKKAQPGHSRSDSLTYSGQITSQSAVNSPVTGNVLPTGNICPSGRILKTGMGMTNRSAKADVLGSGTANYGHGSIMRGGGSAKCVNLDVVNSASRNAWSVRPGIVDPEEVKRTGNEMYKKGCFGEALGLYDKAIALAPGNAAYRSNRAAALMGLGRVVEAVKECEEAVRLDPNYWRAHQRLGVLLIRLGLVESARKRLCFPGQHPDPVELQKLQLVEKHLSKCSDARKVNDWNGTLREAEASIAAGADYCPQLFMCIAEALLKLHQLEDAESCLLKVPKLEPYANFSQTRFFGMLSEAYPFLVQAQIEMALGRFENAVAAAEKAGQIDSRNVEVAVLLKNVRLVARARTRGNDLFKSERFTEACSAYGEGLRLDPANSVLYCNRAACWFKLGSWERSIDDCNQALRIQPNYTKALLRRAASNSKLERWADAVRDYEVLRRELPDDNGVAESLFHAQVALKKSRGEEVYNMKFGGTASTLWFSLGFPPSNAVVFASLPHNSSTMKLTVKTLKGSHFEIKVHPTDTIMGVKKNIEDAQGKDNYPCGQQLLIHNGKVLKDETTLADNKVTEDGFLVVMLSKSKTGTAGTSSTQPVSTPPTTTPTSISTPAPDAQALDSNSASASDSATANAQSDTYGQAASNLVAGSNLEQTIQQIMDMGGGTWDKETVTRALRAAYNNPERAVDYLYSGIPETAEVAVPVARFPADQATQTGAAPAAPAPAFGAPNSSPLNMFPETISGGGGGAGGGLGSLDFLRNNQQFQALRSMVQANPQILQPMLQELGKQNPQLLRIIQEHHAEFLQLINEPLDGSEGDIFDQPDQDMPHAINVTPAEQEAIERLEAMGFDRALVIEAFLACDRNEQLAANYLLENAGDFED